eukprot:1809570-Rhodomonas_salina.2
MTLTKAMRTEVPQLEAEEGKGGEKSKANLSPGEVCKLQTMLSQTGKNAGAGGASRESSHKRESAESGHKRDKAGGQRKCVPYSESCLRVTSAAASTRVQTKENA